MGEDARWWGLALIVAGLVLGWICLAVLLHRDHRHGGGVVDPPPGPTMAGWFVIGGVCVLVLAGVVLLTVAVFSG